MVGDYISCSAAGGKAVAIFAVGKPPANDQAFDEAMYSARRADRRRWRRPVVQRRCRGTAAVRGHVDTAVLVVQPR